MSQNLEIHIGDCLQPLKKMPDQSVHCCVTSPPYFGLRDYGVDGQIGLESTPDEFVAAAVDDVEDGPEHGCAPCWSPGGIARNFEEKKGRMILPCA